ncbi:hypothetical protein [[Limnothrix rosea] IAM M-220]|uniref:hypothetical protein n=1 Tax=[Limnothrix rosea] IAM M-220 TaxID=454133 RepID=UPI000961E2E2|nr:hypothetical protein [[Limnothrix rosea] IAM M-220]OKH12160.1 hypothetical protein NIES208_16465 [[Limnothrix rosea] IAM M-220]
MSNSQISSVRRQREKKKRQLQQRQTQLKHHWALHQAKQQATQMGLKGAQRHLSRPRGMSELDASVLDVMLEIWSRRGTFAPANLANIFLQQTESVSYADYKQALMRYLWTAIADEDGLQPLRQKMQETLDQLWPDQDRKKVDLRLKLRTCNRLISLITTQGYPYPSPMFTLLAVQEQYDVFGLILLRLMLLSRPSYQCFADAIAALREYYDKLKNSKSQWIVHFLEAFQLNISEYLDRSFDQKNKFKPQNHE